MTRLGATDDARALEQGLEDKAGEFRERGSELYVKP